MKRNGNFETSAVVKNQRVKQHEQRSLGDCWQWKANGQCSKGNTIRTSVQNRHSRILLRDLLRTRMREMRREPEVPEAEAQVRKWLDCRARITSKELAPLHSVKKGILQSACSSGRRMDTDLGKRALMHTASLMQPVCYLMTV